MSLSPYLRLIINLLSLFYLLLKDIKILTFTKSIISKVNLQQYEHFKVVLNIQNDEELISQYRDLSEATGEKSVYLQKMMKNQH